MDLASNDSASPLAQGERIEVRGFSNELNGCNPHPALSLSKGEAKSRCDHAKSNNDC
jgi:hypothetical protein